MYKVHPDGSISADTPEEALRLQQLILKQPPPVHSAAQVARYGPIFDALVSGHSQPHSAYSAHTNQSSGSTSAATSTYVVSFLESLKPYDGKVVNSGQMAKIMGTDSSTAVGPKLRGYRSALEKNGLSLDSYLKPEKNPDGTTSWLVRYYNSTTEKSA